MLPVVYTWPNGQHSVPPGEQRPSQICEPAVQQSSALAVGCPSGAQAQLPPVQLPEQQPELPPQSWPVEAQTQLPELASHTGAPPEQSESDVQSGHAPTNCAACRSWLSPARQAVPQVSAVSLLVQQLPWAPYAARMAAIPLGAAVLMQLT